MTEANFDIQSLVDETGIPRRTIHFYVQQGVLPPPKGAGLGATYSEEHLLGLQLIPILRGQGLRLDEIRQRFTAAGTEDLRKMVESANTLVSLKPVPAPVRQMEWKPPGDDHNIREQSGIPTSSPVGIPVPPSGQPFRHYSFPGGVTILAPERLNAADRRRLEQLLQAAQQIFQTSSGPLYAAGDQKLDSDPSRLA